MEGMVRHSMWAFAQEADDFAYAMGGGGGHGNDRLLDSELGFELEDFLGRADHGDIVDAGIPFVLVVIEERDRLETHAALEGKLVGEDGAGVASADDGDPAAHGAAPFGPGWRVISRVARRRRRTPVRPTRPNTKFMTMTPRGGAKPAPANTQTTPAMTALRNKEWKMRARSGVLK